MTDSENLDGCTLTDTELEELFEKQVEGTFMWVNKSGQPFGVITYYLWRNALCINAEKPIYRSE